MSLEIKIGEEKVRLFDSTYAKSIFGTTASGFYGKAGKQAFMSNFNEIKEKVIEGLIHAETQILLEKVEYYESQSL